MSHTSLPGELERVVLRFLEDAATPRALAVSLMLRAGEWDQLVSLSCIPAHYEDAESFARDAQVTALLRKCEDLPTTIDRKAVAEGNFITAEQECARTNTRLLPFLRNYGLRTEDMAIWDFIVSVRKEVAWILGETCPHLEDGRFGPGATFADRGLYSTIPDKMSSRPTFTSDAWSWLIPWAGTAWASACASSDRHPLSIRGNRFTTVPKDCTKHRGIAVEPSVNVFYQLAYGRLMKARLKARGYDLLVAQDIHKRVACEASIRGHLATLDLSNASDTVCKNLVKLLLPKEWFQRLSSLRSLRTHFRGKWVLLEKFSSMGNGYTFELETVIFLAISRAVFLMKQGFPATPDDVRVFGDDIIVPSSIAEVLVTTLRFFGFQTNVQKTFVSGPFRESCGGDYFRGVDVRPYFLKEIPSEPQHYIALANGLRRFSLTSTGVTDRWPYLRRAWFGVLDAIPSHIRGLRGPEQLGDLVIHDEEQRWRHRWRSSIRYLGVYRPATSKWIGWEHFKPDVVLASATYGLSGDTNRKGWSRGVIPRDAVLGYKCGWVPYS
jgi:hypothetical protein